MVGRLKYLLITLSLLGSFKSIGQDTIAVVNVDSIYYNHPRFKNLFLDYDSQYEQFQKNISFMYSFLESKYYNLQPTCSYPPSTEEDLLQMSEEMSQIESDIRFLDSLFKSEEKRYRETLDSITFLTNQQLLKEFETYCKCYGYSAVYPSSSFIYINTCVNKTDHFLSFIARSEEE